MKNFHGKDLASAKWLQTHFQAKSRYRVSQITSLPIHEGDKILDVCSGPAIFSKYILPLVGERGHVHCIDHDPVNIDVADIQLGSSCLNNWSTECADISRAIEISENYDTIIIFNSLCYLGNPLNFINKLANNMKFGARIFLKDFDLSFITINTVDPIKWASLIKLAKETNFENNPLPYDNFFGQHIHEMHEAFSFSKFENLIWTQHLGYPYSAAARKYIWENIRSLLDQTALSLDACDKNYFITEFNEETGLFFNKKNGKFIENEFVSILTK